MSKTVWITGASSGIGREFARRYARLGFRLILTARRTDRLEALAAELTAKHSTFCRILPADLEQESECARLCEALTDERIDIFINNAGFGVCGSFLETSGEKELSMAKVNVLAMHQLFKFAVKKMEAQGFGTVLNVASSAGLLPGGPYMAGYYATKAYVVSLTRGVAEELREQHSPVYVCALLYTRVAFFIPTVKVFSWHNYCKFFLILLRFREIVIKTDSAKAGIAACCTQWPFSPVFSSAGGP